MQSLLDLYNMREGKQPGSDLLEFYQGNGQAPEPQVIDRATFLPIGQYEDGSLTLAWPGFLKDAYEGATRSLVAQEGSPIFDDGEQYVSGAEMQPLDAFNAASVGPVGGVAGRAAGAIPRGALGSGGSDMLSGAKGIRAYHGSPHDFEKFDPSKIGTGDGTAQGHGHYFAKSESEARNIGETVTSGKPHMYEVNINAPEDTFFDWDRSFVPAKAFDNLDEVSRAALLEDVKKSGAARQWAGLGNGTTDITGQQFFEALARQHGRKGASDILKGMGYPGISYRGLDDRSFAVFDASTIDIMRKYANPETASLPYLMTNGMEGDQQQGYGLLAPSFQNANTDPAYETRQILEMMLKRKPPRRFIDMLDQQDQYPIDNPNEPPQDFQPLMPLKRKNK